MIDKIINENRLRAFINQLIELKTKKLTRDVDVLWKKLYFIQDEIRSNKNDERR